MSGDTLISDGREYGRTMKVSQILQNKVKNLPDTPGVYLFLNSKKQIIYVGKAKRLKRRVVSYFQSGRGHDARIERLISEIRDLRFIRASSEAEALIYEAGLIKDHSPRYNVGLKDDKSYPFLKLTVSEKYPRLVLTRKRIHDGSEYYGPYVNVKLLRSALSFMKKVFPLRSCIRLRKKVCLEYHLGQCIGPCEGKGSIKEYSETVRQLKQFLEGRKADLLSSLQEKMKELSKQRKYEKALLLKNRIEALTAVQTLHDRSQYPIFGELDELQNTLELPTLPVNIECFDISNLSGKQAVGSMVRFVAGRAHKSDYRKYRIKTVTGIDDYSMIREVVRRRYSRLVKENAKLPDLVLIDGGRGHLKMAEKELKSIGLGRIPVAAIAKEFNHLYTTSRKIPIRLSPGSRLLNLVQRIRDEAHRFAVKYHRTLRSKSEFSTRLTDIQGIGEITEKKLIERFGNIEKIQKSSEKELISSGINKKIAHKITDYFKNNW